LTVKKKRALSKKNPKELNMPHENLKVIYENAEPKGIRDTSGYLFFFPKVTKFDTQEERYREELQESFALADFLLNALRERS
jgi:hypothetical protein